MLTNEQISATIASLVGLIPAGKTKEELELVKGALALAENVLVNLNTIASSIDALAKSFVEPHIDIKLPEQG